MQKQQFCFLISVLENNIWHCGVTVITNAHENLSFGFWTNSIFFLLIEVVVVPSFHITSETLGLFFSSNIHRYEAAQGFQTNNPERLRRFFFLCDSMCPQIQYFREKSFVLCSIFQNYSFNLTIKILYNALLKQFGIYLESIHYLFCLHIISYVQIYL